MHKGLDVTDPDAIKAWNETMIEKYDLENYFNHKIPLIRWIEARRVNKILHELVTDDASRTLEVGCGAGQILVRVPKGKLSGFDLSEKMIESTRSKILKQFPDRLDVLVPGDAQSWPAEIKSQHYTNIYCSEVIEHIPNPRALMENLADVVDTDTKAVVISTPNEPLINFFKNILIKIGIFKFLFPNISHNMTEEWHLSSFDIPLMEKMCDGLFRIKKIQGAPFRWLPIRYIFTLEKINPADPTSL